MQPIIAPGRRTAAAVSRRQREVVAVLNGIGAPAADPVERPAAR